MEIGILIVAIYLIVISFFMNAVGFINIIIGKVLLFFCGLFLMIVYLSMKGAISL